VDAYARSFAECMSTSISDEERAALDAKADREAEANL